MDNRTDQPSSINPEQRSDTPEKTEDVMEKSFDSAPLADSPSMTNVAPPPPAFASVPKPDDAGTPPPPSGDDTPAGQSPAPSDGSKKNLGIMLAALLVLMVVFFSLIYYFVMRQPSEPEQPNQQLPIENSLPTPSVATPSPTPELSEDAVENINIGSPEADLSPVESDLEQL